MENKNKDLAHVRLDYRQDSLHKKDLHKNPFMQFLKWFEMAMEIGSMDANAMTLATADKSGKPSARVVLLKGVDDDGFVFFTNYSSRKGKELAENPHATLLFFWKEIERQIRIEGTVKKISAEDSTKYFQSRPKASQISATASHQSSVISDKEALEKLANEIENVYKNQEVLPRPETWGGYLLIPSCIEFWIGRPNRLHDRFKYSLVGEKWKIDRLSP